MEIKAYNFFFHPLSKTHSKSTKACSIVTNVALSVFSGGIYLLVFGIVRASEKPLKIKHKITPAKTLKPSPKGFVGCPALKNKQKEHLHKLKTLAAQGHWQHLQTHTAHPDSGFDWWMFPINRASAGFGDAYNIGERDIEALKNDPEFIKNYREGVILVAKSWGWDLENNRDVANNSQAWTGYQVRLGKMLQSLTLFGQKDLHNRLVGIINQKGIAPTLEPWIQGYLVPLLP